MSYELHIKNNETDTKHFIGLFDSPELIDVYLRQLYSIVSLNEKQHLLILNEFDKEGKEIISRQLISVAENVVDLQQFLNTAHVIEKKEKEVDLKQMVHDKIVELMD